ncbi:MAG: ABC transporter substrate-binding protein [Pseudomonadota bacterium]
MARISMVLLMVFALGCEREAPEQIRFGLSSGIVTLDPRFVTDATSSRLCRLIYDQLVKFDESFRPIPSLADWELESPTQYVFTLLGDKQFHDGRLLTALDVAATYESILEPQTASPHRSSLDLIEEISTRGDKQIVFKLKRSEPLFPGLLTIGILPQASAAKSNKETLGKIIGSGPFRVLGKWSDKRIILQRMLDEREISFEVTKDQTVRALRMVNGELDILQGGLAPEIAAWLDEQDGITTRQQAGTTFTYLGLNIQDEYLSQTKIRRALAHGINKAELADRLFVGRARLAKSIFTPEHWVYDNNLEGYEFDPEKAKILLSEAGFSKQNPLRLSYKTSSDLFRLRVATVIQHQLANIGVEVKIQSYDWGTFYGDIKAGRFQLYSLSWVGLKLPDIFRYVFHGDSLPPNGANRGQYLSPVVDDLIESAEAAKTIEEKVPIYRKIQQQILADLPYVPLWYEDHVIVQRDDIRGYNVGLDGNFDSLVNVQRSSIR